MTEQELKEKREQLDRELDWELSLFMNQAIDIYLRAFTVGTIVEWQDQRDAILKDALAVIKNRLSSLGVVIADKDVELQTIQDELCTAYYEDDPRRMKKALGKLAGYTKTYPLEEK